MAAYVQSGERVPRRGEVAWTGEEIERFERSGLVMSGSRHKHMNEVRLRKENQVYKEEERRALAMHNWEEERARQAATMASLAKMAEEQAAKSLSLEAQQEAAAIALAQRQAAAEEAERVDAAAAEFDD